MKDGGGGHKDITSPSSSILPKISKGRKRILIVDDEPDISYTLKKTLEQEQQAMHKYLDYEVTTFNDPLIALSNFKHGSYDLVLLDIIMPRMNGFQLHSEIKRIDDKVKVCYISAYEMEYMKLRASFPSLKSDCFINKPVGIDDLLKRVKAELEPD
jgi:CheY-like chemotaxis protein